jgi:hypothetical protein
VQALVEKTHDEFAWVEMGTPVCVVDFCARCGGCLSCLGDNPCPGGSHLWVIYEADPKNPYRSVKAAAASA